MTNEEMEKAIEFILSQQAEFATDIQLLRELQTELLKVQERGEARATQIENIVLRLVNVVEKVPDVIEKVSEVQARTNAQMGDLTAAQVHTDQRLNVLIDIINEGRNGNTQR